MLSPMKNLPRFKNPKSQITIPESGDHHQANQDHYIHFDQQPYQQEPSESMSFNSNSKSPKICITGRNKRKNFNPQPTTPIDTDTPTKIDFTTLGSSNTFLSDEGAQNESNTDSLSKINRALTFSIFHSTRTPLVSGLFDRDFSQFASVNRSSYSQPAEFNACMQGISGYEWADRPNNIAGSSEEESQIHNMLRIYQSYLGCVNLSTERKQTTPPTRPLSLLHCDPLSEMLDNVDMDISGAPKSHSSANSCKEDDVGKSASCAIIMQNYSLNFSKKKSPSSCNSEQMLKNGNDHEEPPMTQKCDDDDECSDGSERWFENTRRIDDITSCEENDDDGFGKCAEYIYHEDENCSPLLQNNFWDSTKTTADANANGRSDCDDDSNGNFSQSSYPRSNTDGTCLHLYVINRIQKFTSYLECQNEICRLENLREHYHCHNSPCAGEILSKKETFMRHVKWHRKRIDSLNYGFMRFSSSDDCSNTFGVECQHNRKQTHYHCFQPNCDRVYISTSDVHMHSNFHRKDSAIYKEGFQRVRANEKCEADFCTFSDKKRTHFHCRRDDCRYTFKNKAEMEKHKNYHTKDLKLAREGFKKFLKNETCPYEQCKFSKVCNHIHCARKNCFYVLHSSGRLLSHKRKHEKLDYEQTFCRYKMLTGKSAIIDNTRVVSTDATSLLLPEATESFTSSQSPPIPQVVSPEPVQEMKKSHDQIFNQKTFQTTNMIDETSTGPNISIKTKKPCPSPKLPNQSDITSVVQDSTLILTPSLMLNLFSAECPGTFGTLSTKRKNNCHWQDCSQPHLHCIRKSCEAVIPNKILDISKHIRMHGLNLELLTPKNVLTIESPSQELTPRRKQDEAESISGGPMQVTNIEGFFKRKRGRPPKNRFVEVYKNAQQSPQAIFTSFKLKKQTKSKENTDTIGQHPTADNWGSAFVSNTKQPMHLQLKEEVTSAPLGRSFTVYEQHENCTVSSDDAHCSLAMQHHYHCTCTPDCMFATREYGLLTKHLNSKYTTFSFGDNISKKCKQFDRNIGIDCGVVECRLGRFRPHLHCRQCNSQISPFDLESHNCAEYTKQSNSSVYETDYSSRCDQPESHTIDRKTLVKDYSSFFSSVNLSTLNEVQGKTYEIEAEEECLPRSKRTSEEEKVLVVRAAGTYFPKNTSDLSYTSSADIQQKSTLTASCGTNAGHTFQSSSIFCPSALKNKKKLLQDDHCEEPFVDLVKSRTQQYENLPARTHVTQMPHLKKSEDSQSIIDQSFLFPIHSSSTPAINSFEEQPQDLSFSQNTNSIATDASIIQVQDEQIKTVEETSSSSTASLPVQLSLIPAGNFLNLFSQNLSSIRNTRLDQLANLYQRNPYYNPRPLSNNMRFGRDQQQSQQTTALSNSYLTTPSQHIPFYNPFLMMQSSISTFDNEKITQSKTVSLNKTEGLMQHNETSNPRKRRQNDRKELNTIIDNLSQSPFKMETQFSTTDFRTNNQPVESPPSSFSLLPAVCTAFGNKLRNSNHGQGGNGQQFKNREDIIPNGYLKFRFNEDCSFAKCGYRNHQSHFHCDRNDCHYSFCDKTRFVQHTARHERLDKLMGNDFRQFRANMSCGYENCPYYKNLGSTNKSSHFHCLKCDLICSDSNKVVAHRRQHKKLEFIRRAGFRKVTSHEKCDSEIDSIKSANCNEKSGECSYSKKQTHYHCLICNASLLSKIGSHRH